MNEYTEANRRHWDEVVPYHVRSLEYDVDGFRGGQSRLKPVERAELGDVRGKTLLHLQCHFGLDTLSWAREGAIVTGADFSGPAIEAARALAKETGIDARFVLSDIYSLPSNLSGQFDIVFTSYGALTWLPDIREWAKVAAHFVRPGGVFYLVEFHPVAQAFDDDPAAPDLRLRYPYFPTGGPVRVEEDGTYADRGARISNRVFYCYPFTVADVVTALIDAGLRLDYLHEFPFTTFPYLPLMTKTDEMTYRLTDNDGSIPLMFSLKAMKPA
jgi:SAM-dependent methyltransferase